jgi:hypothetical protein
MVARNRLDFSIASLDTDYEVRDIQNHRVKEDAETKQHFSVSSVVDFYF